MAKPNNKPRNSGSTDNRGRNSKPTRKDTRNGTTSKDNSSYGKKDYGKGYTGSSSNQKSFENVCDKTTNDFSYYNKYPTDIQAAGNFPWYKVIGDSIDLSTTVGSYNQVGSYGTNLPGIMAIDFVPGPGISESSGDASNRAFSIMMADLYAKTSGGQLNFQQADLAMLMLSMSSIANLIALARRALSATDFWIAKNKFYPRALVHAMGFSWSNLVQNKPNYVQRLNSSIHRFNSIQMPKFLDIFNRQFAMTHNIFVDEDSDFGQIYFFNPKGYYLYDDENSMCKFTDISTIIDPSGTDHTGNFQSLLYAIEQALDYWYNSQDLYIINGALLRCYNGASTVYIEPMTLDTLINPVVDKNFLMQIMNMDIVNYNELDTATLNINQDVAGNALVWKPQGPFIESETIQNPLRISTNKLLRYFGDVPPLEDNVEMTRLCVTEDVLPAGAGYYQYISSMGTEFVVGVRIYTISPTESGFATELYELKHNAMLAEETNSTIIKYGVGALSPFRYIPYVPLLQSTGQVYPLGDLYNYTILDRNTLTNLNKAANLSIWKVTL